MGKPKTAAERMREMRQRLREDPQKNQAHLAKEREKDKKRREDMKKKVASSSKLLKQKNKGKKSTEQRRNR